MENSKEIHIGLELKGYCLEGTVKVADTLAHFCNNERPARPFLSG